MRFGGGSGIESLAVGGVFQSNVIGVAARGKAVYFEVMLIMADVSCDR